MPVKRIVLIGATGSIGENTLKVIRANSNALRLVGIAGNKNYERLAEIAREFDVSHIAISDSDAHHACKNSPELLPDQTKLYAGPEGLEEIATTPEYDILVVAAVGVVALQATMKAIEAGKEIALASKEILVLAGKFVMAAARKHKVNILPVDSEHNAIFQCLGNEPQEAIHRLILTASGGPFRNHSLEQMKNVQPEDAIKHPNWKMGKKITVDSSTMANKGLELFEARWLFDVSPKQLEVVVHPQSIVHSMVEFADGSVIAQLSPPSMTFAIQHILLYPNRKKGVHESIDFRQNLQLDFNPPDFERFPCLRLAFECLKSGGTAPAIYNAANEIAVTAFLRKKISYPEIPILIDKTLNRLSIVNPQSLEEVLNTDQHARDLTFELIQNSCT